MNSVHCRLVQSLQIQHLEYNKIGNLPIKEIELLSYKFNALAIAYKWLGLIMKLRLSGRPRIKLMRFHHLNAFKCVLIKTFFRNSSLQTEQRNMKTFRRMDRSSEAITITILISIFSLFVSDVVCISHRFESQEVEVLHHHSSHLPIQPELVRTFEHCHKRASTFDLCIKNAFNELRVYFKTGKFFFPPILT